MQAVNNIIKLSKPDEEIIDNVKRGLVEEFRFIMKRYNQRLYRIAVSFGINDFDIEDILQRTFISAYRKLSQFKGDAKFSTWLTRILINECLMYKRSVKNLRKNEEYQNPETVKNILSSNNPEEIYMKSELKQILENTIKMLPEKYRAVYIVREVEGLSTKEASEVLKISEENVKIRLFRSKELLKTYLLNNYDKKELLSFGNERCDRVTDFVMNYLTCSNRGNL